MSTVVSVTWLVCPICGLFRLDDPPHGQAPCPEKIRVDNAQVEMLEAQKANYLGTGMAMNDLGVSLKKMMGKSPFSTDDDD